MRLNCPRWSKLQVLFLGRKKKQQRARKAKQSGAWLTIIAAKCGNGTQLRLYTLYCVIKKAMEGFTVVCNRRIAHAHKPALFCSFAKVLQAGGYSNHPLDGIALFSQFFFFCDGKNLEWKQSKRNEKNHYSLQPGSVQMTLIFYYRKYTTADWAPPDRTPLTSGMQTT